MKTDETIVHRDPIYSRLADDLDLRDIVEMFVEEMPGRVETLLNQLESADWDGLRRTTHQLKGAAKLRLRCALAFRRQGRICHLRW